MKLEDIANITVGQIMTRVSVNTNIGNKVLKKERVLIPKAISNGVIIANNLGYVDLIKEIDKEKYTQEGDVILKLSTPYDAAYVTFENVGLAIPSFCAAIRVFDKNVDAKYISAFLNTKYIKDILTEKADIVRPMVKISDIRALKIPKVSLKDMKDIGEAYMHTGQKKEVLHEMINAENTLMENIVLTSIKEGMENE